MVKIKINLTPVNSFFVWGSIVGWLSPIFGIINVLAMNYYSLIPLASLISGIFITALILGKDMRKPAHQAFIMFSLALQAWAALDFINWNLEGDNARLMLMKMQSVTWLAVGFLFLNFIYVFLSRRKDVIYKVIRFAMVASILLSLSGNLVIEDCKTTFWGADIKPGILFFPVVFIVMLTPFLFAIHLIYKELRRTTSFTRRKQLVLLFSGTLTAIVAGITTDILMPYVFHIAFPGLSSTASVFQSVLIFVAVTRYGFLAVEISEIAEELFHNVNDAVIVMNTGGKVVNYNSAARDMMGEDIGNISLEKEIEAYKANTPYDSFETVLKANNGRKTVLLTQSCVKHLGSIIAWILIVRDITRKKQMELELIEKNKELDAFVYKASHDLKGPLSSVKGLVALAREGLENKATLSYIDMIEKTASRMDKVLLDLLQVTRIKKSDIVPGKIMLKKLVDEILDSLQYTPGYSKVTIEVYCDEKAGLYSDLNSVSSVIQNLVVNAISYRNPEAFASWLDIMIKTNEKGAEIVIADNGIGIPEDQQEKVFEMFHRVSNFAEGTGLGLYIVKSAMARLGGTIRLESQVDKGTKFFIFIPDTRTNTERASSLSPESALSLTGAA